MVVGLRNRQTPTALSKASARTMERSIRFAAPRMPEMRPSSLRKELAQGCPACQLTFAMVLETGMAPTARSWPERGVGLVSGSTYMRVRRRNYGEGLCAGLGQAQLCLVASDMCLVRRAPRPTDTEVDASHRDHPAVRPDACARYTSTMAGLQSAQR